MPNYSDILRSLAADPPQSPAQQRLHASLLELMASCLRAETASDDGVTADAIRASYDQVAAKFAESARH